MNDSGQIYVFGPFRLDTPAHTLTRDGVDVPLPPKLFDVLRLLLEADGQTVDKDRFMTVVWSDAVVEEGSLTRSVSRLRSILGEGASDEEYIKTVARRGYRFAAPVSRVAREPVASDVPPVPFGAISAPIAPASSARPRWRIIAIAGTAAAIALAAWWFIPQRAPATTPQSLAVLPFQGLDAAASAGELGLGLADSLITRLANQPGLTVRSTNAVRDFTGPDVDAVDVGRRLAVDRVLEGTVRRVEGKYRVSARLIDVSTGEAAWGSTFDEGSLNLLAVEDRLTERVANALAIALTPGRRDTHGLTTNPEAYEAYLRGRFLAFKLASEAFAESRASLDRAIALDPAFARAHSALAFLHIQTVDLVAPPRVAFAAARVAVTRALELDPRLADAHATLGMIEWQYEWNWAEAERHFRQAIDLDPNDPFTRSQYAFFLASMGRAEESIVESDRACELDPLALDFGVTNSVVLLWARRFADAEKRAEHFGRIDSHFWLFAVVHGRALEGQGRFDEAITEYRRALKLEGSMPEALMDLGRAQARAGRRAEAAGARQELEAFGRRAYAAPFHLAVIDAALGETDRAFEELDRAIESRSWYVTWLQVDPSLDPLRNDPRFAVRLQRAGFTPPS